MYFSPSLSLCLSVPVLSAHTDTQTARKDQIHRALHVCSPHDAAIKHDHSKQLPAAPPSCFHPHATWCDASWNRAAWPVLPSLLDASTLRQCPSAPSADTLIKGIRPQSLHRATHPLRDCDMRVHTRCVRCDQSKDAIREHVLSLGGQDVGCMHGSGEERSGLRTAVAP